MEASAFDKQNSGTEKQVGRPPIVDVEASGFGPQGYPIEIGLVLPNGSKYCTLIKPVHYWTHWDDSAEQIHHISRDYIESHGKQVTEIALDLNEMLYDRVVYTDGWVVDKPWIDQIFMMAKTPRRFHVSALEMIMTESQIMLWDETKAKVIENLSLTRHRASSDAMIVQETFYQTYQLLKPVIKS